MPAIYDMIAFSSSLLSWAKITIWKVDRKPYFYIEFRILAKSITYSVVGLPLDGQAFKPRVAASYISYFKRGLKLLKYNNEAFFEIKDVSELKRLKAKLLRSSAFKNIAKSSQDHISSVFGKYIKYIEYLHSVEQGIKVQIDNLTESYYEFGFDKNKKKLASFIKSILFVYNPRIKPPKFTEILSTYFELKDAKEFKRFCKVVYKFHADLYNEIVVTDSKLTSKLLAILAHIKFLKSKL